MLCAAQLCAGVGQTNSRMETEVHRVSFLGDGPSFASLGLLVSFACRAGLNNRVASLGFARRAGPRP